MLLYTTRSSVIIIFLITVILIIPEMIFLRIPFVDNGPLKVVPLIIQIPDLSTVEESGFRASLGLLLPHFNCKELQECTLDRALYIPLFHKKGETRN